MGDGEIVFFIKKEYLSILVRYKSYLSVGIFTILGLFVISGCVQNKNTFLDHLDEIDLTNSYTINQVSSYASSGGGDYSNGTVEIKSDELKQLVNETKNMNITCSFETGNRNCYCGSIQWSSYFICFADNRIVNYLKHDGPWESHWNAVEYPFDIKRNTVINSITDLKACSTDSDCTLTSIGVCDITGRCAGRGYQCDRGSRTAINNKHYLIWDFVPLIEDQCFTEKFLDLNKDKWKASCTNNICETEIIN